MRSFQDTIHKAEEKVQIFKFHQGAVIPISCSLALVHSHRFARDEPHLT